MKSTRDIPFSSWIFSFTLPSRYNRIIHSLLVYRKGAFEVKNVVNIAYSFSWKFICFGCTFFLKSCSPPAATQLFCLCLSFMECCPSGNRTYVFKSRLKALYTHRLSQSFDPDNIRSWRIICPIRIQATEPGVSMYVLNLYYRFIYRLDFTYFCCIIVLHYTSLSFFSLIFGPLTWRHWLCKGTLHPISLSSVGLSSPKMSEINK